MNAYRTTFLDLTGAMARMGEPTGFELTPEEAARIKAAEADEIEHNGAPAQWRRFEDVRLDREREDTEDRRRDDRDEDAASEAAWREGRENGRAL